jgi:TIGR03009 family protein
MVICANPRKTTGLANEEKGKPVTSARSEELLKGWNKANEDARQIHYAIQLTIEDKVLNQKTIRQGEGFVKKPNQARVNWKDEKGNLKQVYLCIDQHYEIYDFEKKEKLLLRVPSENAKEGLLSNWLVQRIVSGLKQNFEWMFLGLPEAELKKRFEISLLKEDDNWAYLQLSPLTDSDQPYFRKLRIVLNQKTHLIRQMCVFDNTSLMTFDFQNIEVNSSSVSLESFTKDLPKNFKEIDFLALWTQIDAKAPDSKRNRP